MVTKRRAKARKIRKGNKIEFLYAWEHKELEKYRLLAQAKEDPLIRRALIDNRLDELDKELNRKGREEYRMRLEKLFDDLRFKVKVTPQVEFVVGKDGEKRKNVVGKKLSVTILPRGYAKLLGWDVRRTAFAFRRVSDRLTKYYRQTNNTLNDMVSIFGRDYLDSMKEALQ